MVVRPLLPSLARTGAALVAAGALAATTAGAALAGQPLEAPARAAVGAENVLEAPVLRLINRTRHAHGLAPLRLSASLARAAEAHASEMARNGFFAHESADGTSAADRILRYYRVSGYRRWTVGENLLWRSPDVSPGEALRMWLDSPPHRRVLLLASFSEIGLAAVHVGSAGGDYGGHAVTILVADFGGRS